MSTETITTEEFIQSDPGMFYVTVHEAGHALMCFLLGLYFGRTSIVPDKESAGRVRTRYAPGSYSLAEREKDAASVCFAGEQAVRVIFWRAT